MTSQQLHSSDRTGKLDPEFGENGFKYLESPHPDYPKYHSTVVAVGPDDMIYVAGQAYSDVLPYLNTLTRLDQRGSIDENFGENGFFYSSLIGTHESSFIAEQIVFLEIEEKILISGEATYYDNGPRIDKAIIRFNLNGTIDEDFGDKGAFIFRTPSDGKVLLDEDIYNAERLKIAKARETELQQPTPLTSSTSCAMTITDDHILLLHQTYSSFSKKSSFIIRVTHDGKLDEKFNNRGYVEVTHAEFPFVTLESLVIDKAGNYISAGTVRRNYSGAVDAIALVKHSKDGALDTDFQTGGFLFIKSDNENSYFSFGTTVKQDNNRILFLGTQIYRDLSKLKAEGLLISLEADGSRNIKFNSGKPVFFTINSSNTFFFNANFHPDGSFLVTGDTKKSTSSPYHYAVTRFEHNGVHDEKFGNGGWFEYKDTIVPAYATSVISNNKIICSSFPADGNLGRRPIARGLMS